MSDTPPFEIETIDHTLVVTPTRNVSTLAEEMVDSQMVQIKALLAKNKIERVLFDLGKIAYFGSAMLEAMLSIWKALGAKSHQVAFCRVGESSHEVLKVSRFDTVWDIFSDRQEALESFK